MDQKMVKEIRDTPEVPTSPVVILGGFRLRFRVGPKSVEDALIALGL